MASPFSGYRGTAAPAITASQFANAGQQGAMLGQGLAQAGDAIGKVLEQRKADAQETKMLRSMLDTYDPDNKDIHATLGLGELRGKRDAFAMAITRQQQQRQQEEHDARMAAYRQAQAAQAALTQSAGEASSAAGKQDLSNLTRSMTRGGMAGPALGMAGFMDPSQRTPVTADALMQAIARNSDAINTPFAQQLIMSQAKENTGWGLKPGQVIDLGNGVKGAATSRNSLQIIGDDGQTYEIPEGGNYEYDAQGNIVIKDKNGNPLKVKRGASENPMIAILKALRPELFPATPAPQAPTNPGASRLRYNPATGTLEPVK